MAQQKSDEQLNEEIGFARAELSKRDNINGNNQPPDVHFFVTYKHAIDWAGRVEGMDNSPVADFDALAKELNPEGRKQQFITTAVEAHDGESDGDVLIFPQKIRVPQGASRSREIMECVLKQMKDGGALEIEGAEPINEGHVFVCCHQARDARCGYCGPKIVDAVNRSKVQSGDGEKVKVYKCSHIGGHRYAGIGIIARNDEPCTMDWLMYLTDSDEDAKHVVNLATGREETPEISKWRARTGKTTDEHKALCKACMEKNGTADIEEVVPSGEKEGKLKAKNKKTKPAEMTPEQLEAELGFQRPDFQNRDNVAGLNQTPDVHVFVAFHKALEWDNRVEGMEGSPLPEFDKLVKELHPSARKNEIVFTAIEASGSTKEGDVLIFPQKLRVAGGASRPREIVEAIMKQKSEGGDLTIKGAEPTLDGHVFVCCHKARDARCGYCGPKVIDALEVSKKDRTIQNVETHRCSHIGGHRYAGLGIVFRPGQDKTCDWLAYITDSKEDIDHVLDLATGAVETPELAMWRARMGTTQEEHKALCAACSDNKGGCGGDMEDFGNSSAQDKPNVLFVLGGPGAGKGTQCGLIVEEFEDFEHLSAGDLLRIERKDPTSKNGLLIDEYIKEGKIVPVEITVQLLLNAMQKSSCKNFLVDGFPRNQNNLEGWEKVVGNKANVLGCLQFECPEAVMESRLLERGKTSGRSDDNIESIRKRFKTYVDSTKPIVEHFAKENKCYRIEADRPVHLVFADVRKTLRDTLKLKADKPRVVFVLGGPGAGKGTQCELLTQEFDLCHLSAGDLLRAERNNPDSKDGALIKSYITEGKIVPVEITVNLLLKAMLSSGRGNFLIDGFPRNKNNLDGWVNTVKDQADVLGCLYFDCPESVMEARLLERGKTSGRTDDNIESIKKRFRTYQEETMPIIKHFDAQGKCFQIDANRPKNIISNEVLAVFENKLGLRPLNAWTNPPSEAAASNSSSVLSSLSSQVRQMPVMAKVAIGAAGAAAVAYAVRQATFSTSARK